jgi:dihydrofolate reductase
MRKLIVSMNVTLDGFMSGPDCELDWHFKYWNNEMEDELCKQLAKADTILLGGITYSAMAKYWPSKLGDPLCRAEGFAFANMMNSYTKIVVSKTITSANWNNSKLVSGNLIEEINAIKKLPGKNIMVYGSGQLTDALIKLSMVDEYQHWLHPVILGKGKPLLKPYSCRKAGRLKLELLSSERFTSGVILLHYQVIAANKNDSK